MSSVRMSEKLRDRIIAQGNAIFTFSATQVRNALSKDIHQRAAEEYVNSNKADFDAVPDKWQGKVNQVTYKIDYLVDDLTIEYSWNQESLTKKLTIPKVHDLYSESYGNAKILEIPKGFPFSQGISDEISKWREAIRNTEKEQKRFMDELKRILKRTNTLKQFLDTWPQGENLVPNDVLAKLNEKPVREKKEPLMTEEASVELSTTLLKRTLMS